MSDHHEQSVSQPIDEVTTEAATQAWNAVCEQIRAQLTDTAFQTWFQPIVPLRFENHILTVKVPSKFYRDWIDGHYKYLLNDVLFKALGGETLLHYSVPLSAGECPELPTVSEKITQPAAARRPENISSNLNPRYRFNNFIEGPGNNFAKAASLAVSNDPGTTTYNPLLLYGGVGLGKTHLLQAIGNEVHERNPKLVIRYISSERFTQDFVEAIRSNSAVEFSARYRSIDVLLLDDIQFLIDRERTQMEFFHTFNTLHQSGKQIVLTSDKPPKELGGMDKRLISRIGWGLVCDISPPDYDTRIAIIQRYAEEECFELPSDVCDYLAHSITDNVREIQGALIRLFALANIKGKDITLDLAKRSLQDLFDAREVKIGVDDVQRTVARHFRVPPDLLLSKTRTQPIARTRMIAMALSVRMTGLSLKQIGRHFGNRDHTTVLHARDSVAKWEADNNRFSDEINIIIQMIRDQAM